MSKDGTWGKDARKFHKDTINSILTTCKYLKNKELAGYGVILLARVERDILEIANDWLAEGDEGE